MAEQLQPKEIRVMNHCSPPNLCEGCQNYATLRLYYLNLEAAELRAQLKAKDTEHEKERGEFKRIRDLCVRALVRAIGCSAEAVEEGPLTQAIKHAESVKAKDEALRLAFETIAELMRTGIVIPVDQANPDAESLCRAFLDAETNARAALSAIRAARGDGK